MTSILLMMYAHMTRFRAKFWSRLKNDVSPYAIKNRYKMPRKRLVINSRSVNRSRIRISADQASVNLTNGPISGFKKAQVRTTTMTSTTSRYKL